MEWIYFFLFMIFVVGGLGVFAAIGNSMKYKQLERIGNNTSKSTNHTSSTNTKPELFGGWLNTEQDEDENTRYDSNGRRIN